MVYKDMIPGIYYIVVACADDSPFIAGDRVYISQSMSHLCNVTAGGFIETEDIDDIVLGLTVDLDKEWVKRKKEQLKLELEFLEKHTAHLMKEQGN